MLHTLLQAEIVKDRHVEEICWKEMYPVSAVLKNHPHIAIALDIQTLKGFARRSSSLKTGQGILLRPLQTLPQSLGACTIASGWLYYWGLGKFAYGLPCSVLS